MSSKREPGSRLFLPAAAALLAVMGAVMFASALGENDVYDEGGHLAAGYGYWTIHDYGFNAEHPPLGNLLNALPLLWLDLKLDAQNQWWRTRNQPIAGAVFLYRNRTRAGTMLFWGRLPTMAMTLLLGVAVVVWARRHFGDAVALAALGLFAFDPNLITHGRYITTDMIAAVTIFLASIAWGWHLVEGSRKSLVWAGLALGCAFSSKFSTLYLLPVFAALYLVRCWQTGEWSWRRACMTWVWMGVLSAGVMAVCYAPEIGQVMAGQETVKASSLVRGLDHVVQQSGEGMPAFLLGKISETGWWYYFPLAFLLKTPVGTLALIAWSAVAGVVYLVRRRPKLRGLAFHWFVLTVPPGAYLLLSLNSHLNIGLRHVLPIYPFLFVLAPAVLSRLRSPKYLVAVLVGLAAVESLAVYPNYLPFFNVAVGGPANGPRYLADSNVDWGGDVKKLKTYLDSIGVSKVCMAYFGTTDVAYWGVERTELPLTWETAKREKLNCVAAISATLLDNVYVLPHSYDWLRQKKPMAKVGYSIYVYDLRK